MLQQTQVSAVIPYYLKFIERFPDIQTLAAAKTEEVMTYWSGLGYYARARNLHKTAKIIAAQGLPKSAAEWSQMPGVGKSTAAAIAVFSHRECAAILDGNVKRVLARVFAIKTLIQETKSIKKLWQLSEQLLPDNAKIILPYTQGLMDLGATICVRSQPKCTSCPLQNCCLAKKQNLQNTLPHRAAAKPRPIKQKQMAFIINKGAVLLQKRPPRGIWGGLYSLPEHEESTALIQHCQQLLDCKLVPFSPPKQNSKSENENENNGEVFFTHQFTHFHLQARVLLLTPLTDKKTPRKFSKRIAPDYQWVTHKTLLNTPLPAPIKKFLNQFFK